jgi:hypothetical protein
VGELTPKRRVFLEEYLKCWNGTEAARRAEYAHPRQEASRLLSNADIQTAIKDRVAELVMSADEALILLSDQARASVEDFVQFDSSGSRIWRIDLQKAKEAGKLHTLKKLYFDSDGNPHIELYDSQRALELILKAHQAFTERVDVTTNSESLNDGARLSDDRRDALIAAILERARARATTERGESR